MRLHGPCRPLFVAATVLGLLNAVANVCDADPLTDREKFFEQHVRPLLIDRCHDCHAADLQESGLRLDSIDAILQGGLSGPAAIAGNVADSLIIAAVTGRGAELMPPDEPLADDEIMVLRRWVRMGLPWTRMPGGETPGDIPLGDQEAIGRAADEHWAFQPRKTGFLPVGAGVPQPVAGRPERPSYSSEGIDAFVHHRRSEAELDGSPRADRRTLLRRLYYDLVGLPPTIDQVNRFTTDPRPDVEVTAAVVDELLASDHHGERWTRYWLDLARYADTRDWQAQAELRYPYAYTYRDYVIASFNDDKPYDQFIREQLAADFLVDDPGAAELAGLGFLTVGPTFRNNKLELAADRIDVVTRGLMGLTVACARCHDHKYDPVPIEDYYSLYGVFASTDDPDDYPVLVSQDKPDGPLRQSFEEELAAAHRDLHQYKLELRRDAYAAIRKKPAAYLLGFHDLSIAKSGQIRGVVGKRKVLETGMTPLDKVLTDRLKKGSDADDPVLKPWHEALAPLVTGGGKVKVDFDALLKTWSADDSLDAQVAERLAKTQPKTTLALVEMYGQLFADTQLPATWLDFDLEAVAGASRLFGKGRKALGDLEKAITEVEVSHPGAPPRAMVVRDAERILTPFVMLRGEPGRRGDRVPRRFPSILARDDDKPFTDGSGRLELADHIVSPDNPLTARVLVNRVWAKYFGAGLVTSLDDFGLRSDPPSHPELLDYLASGFIENGWSLKWLHRQIANSDTYAQSSQYRDDAAAIDPDNRLLWRQNRRRLDFEAMRDSMLAIAGTLDPSVGGKSVVLSESPYSNRRSVYAYVDRNEMDPMLQTFDFASPTASAASRSETMIPQQALFSMNHPLVAQLSRTIAEEAASPSGDAAVDDLYRQIFARPPSADEVELATHFLEVAAGQINSDSPIWLYGYGTASPNDFTPLPHFTGREYQGGPVRPDPVLRHTLLTAGGGHPGPTADQSVIRRWTAPADGTVRVAGNLKHTRDNGDGVEASIVWHDDRQTFGVFNGEVPTTTTPLNVRRGDTIDFVVSAGETNTADAFSWNVTVIGIGGDLVGQRFGSNDGFGAPPPPPLAPLAQLAQALMLTNEFFYLD